MDSETSYTDPGLNKNDDKKERANDGNHEESVSIVSSTKKSFQDWIAQSATGIMVSVATIIYSITWYFAIGPWITKPIVSEVVRIIVSDMLYVLSVLIIYFAFFWKIDKGKSVQLVACITAVMLLLQLAPLFGIQTDSDRLDYRKSEARIIDNGDQVRFVNMKSGDCKAITVHLSPGEEKRITSTVFIEIITFSEDIYFQKKEGDKKWVEVGINDSFTLPKDSRPTYLKGGPNGSTIDIIGKNI